MSFRIAMHNFLMQLVDTNKYDVEAYGQIFRFFMRNYCLSTGRPRLKPSSFQSTRWKQQEKNPGYALRRGGNAACLIHGNIKSSNERMCAMKGNVTRIDKSLISHAQNN